MISDKDKNIILQNAKKYKVSQVILFGSSIAEGIDANDIDVAIKGIERRKFFKFYAELFKALSKPVDLIDLSEKSLFNKIIEETGVKIYG
ncbi:MAG: nucleotidyltransferase domain-containing protein [Candidatus Omnitrophica bacterium]|nr:nucleotidyltransferase domain-containing protein [Candidatus Omnitrophota bacterium]